MLLIKYCLKLEDAFLPSLKFDPLTALAIGSSIAGGIGSLFSSSSANDTNIRLARENREWQSRENQLNRDWQESMWNRQNEYNTPANQRKLAEEAGYNPYLLGAQSLNSGAGSAGAPAMSGAPNPAHVNPVNPLGVVSDTVSSLLPVIQQQQQIEANVEEQHAKTLETVYRTAFDAYSKGGVSAYNNVMESMAPMLERINWSGSTLEKQLHESIRGQLLDNARKELDNEFQVIENYWSNYLFADKHLLNSDQHKQFVQSLEKIKAEINNINADTEKTRAEKDKIIAERVGVLIDNGLKGIDFQIKQDIKEDIIDEARANADKAGYDALESYKVAKYGTLDKVFPFHNLKDVSGDPDDNRVYNRAINRRANLIRKRKDSSISH